MGSPENKTFFSGIGVVNLDGTFLIGHIYIFHDSHGEEFDIGRKSDTTTKLLNVVIVGNIK